MDDLKRALREVQRPGAYVGGEWGEVQKDKSQLHTRFAFCFPDTYEIGMSHLGMKILYSLLNELPGVWCERVFAPWTDMEREMRERSIPLFALESGDELKKFDFVGFTLQYELCYTNVLNMLSLAGIPLFSKDRGEKGPIVVAGGPCAVNPEPMADFIDLFMIGEGEEVLPELMRLYKDCGRDKGRFLKRAASVEGVYVPAFYDVFYSSDGTIGKMGPNIPEAPGRVRRRIVKDLDAAYYPESFVVPNIPTVHDRVPLEIFRGCIRGCRFCQAGIIYRPVREKNVETLSRQAKTLIENTGYEEISLLSLSTSDYRHLLPLMDELIKWTSEKKVSLALPSLRADRFSTEILDKTGQVRKGTLTFAPEAGTQRLRDVINKNIKKEDLERAASAAFSSGFSNIKLYFMTGLPTETKEDIEGIADLAYAVLACAGNLKARRASVAVSTSCFIPKPFTPFQWEAQDPVDETKEKQKLLLSRIRSKKISYHWHDAKTSFIEAALARGDRRVGKVILKAFESGCKFDSWGEQFLFDAWMESFKQCSLDPAFYACRQRDYSEVLPWDFIDIGVTKEHLMSESEKARAGIVSRNCREECSFCGASELIGGACV